MVVLRVLMVKMSPVAVEEPKLILFESKKALPATDKCIEGVVVAIPRNLFVVSTARKLAESRVETPL